MKSDIFQRVENATVTLTKRKGQGILIRNQMILTACHCISYRLSVKMAFYEEYYFEEIKTPKGNFKVSPLCLEPISDIAVLGGVDGQEFYDDCLEFERFCDDTKPVPICRDKLVVDKKFKIYIYTHKKKWITGIACLTSPESPMIWIKTDEAIKGGTSGSGIINEKGELVGIVSRNSEQDYRGIAPRPLLALPVWVCRKIYKL
jgi:hypothetical protein